MTCQDCIHFRDIDGGECLFACGGMPADCEVNVVCEDKFEYRGDDMTCQGCIYYKPINDKEGKCNSPMDAYYGFDTTVVGDLGKCEYFKPTDNCVGTALDALEMRSATKEERESVNKYIDSISEFTGHNFYDSWESVSK